MEVASLMLMWIFFVLSLHVSCWTGTLRTSSSRRSANPSDLRNNSPHRRHCKKKLHLPIPHEREAEWKAPVHGGSGKAAAAERGLRDWHFALRMLGKGLWGAALSVLCVALQTRFPPFHSLPPLQWRPSDAYSGEAFLCTAMGNPSLLLHFFLLLSKCTPPACFKHHYFFLFSFHSEIIVHIFPCVRSVVKSSFKVCAISPVTL